MYVAKIIVLICAVCVAGCGWESSIRDSSFPNPTDAEVAWNWALKQERGEFGFYGYARVVDGDTIDVAGSDSAVILRIHLDGINAFELGQKCGELPCGAMATKALKDLAYDERVFCWLIPADPSFMIDTKAGHYIGNCKISDLSDLSRDTHLSEWMVENGHAFASRSHYSKDYFPAQIKARDAKKGAWATEKEFDHPDTYRRKNLKELNKNLKEINKSWAP